MLRPDHLFPHDLANEHHQDLSRNVEELQEHGLALSRRISSHSDLARQVSMVSSFHGDKVEDLQPEHICAILKTDPNRGLSVDKAEERLKKDGPNQLTQEPRLGLVMLFLLQLTSFIIILLIIAAIASIVVNATNEGSREEILSYTTGMAIFVLVILNAGIAAYTEHQAGNALDALAKLSQPEVSVLRGGEQVSIPTVDVVRGDIIILETGDVVPADLRLITAQDLKVDEKALTGEPDDVPKNTKIKEQTKLTPENMVFSGCPVANGKCKGVVVATGMDTRIGDIAKMMASEDQEGGGWCSCLPKSAENKTPLQENIESLGARIGVLAILICAIVFVIGLAIGTKDPEYPENPSWIYMILIAVTLAVAAIPEGIPLCVTISLAIGCQEMVQKNVQVRKIAAVETLGSASVICSDKTGTLTEGKMTMTKMWSAGAEYNVTGQGFDPTKGAIFRSGVVMPPGTNSNRDPGVRSTLLAALLCCDTELFCEEDATSGEKTWQYRGNSSEAPIVVAARKAQVAPKEGEYRRLLTIPFSSSRKMMLTVTDVAGRVELCPNGMPLPPQTTAFTVCKGAPNWIIQNCTSILREDGTVAPLSEVEKQQINARVVDAYSDLALRVLAVAVGCIQQPPLDLESEDIPVDEKFEVLKSGLTLAGLVASMDPDREGVQASVVAARGAGIRVVMITGDYLKTAIAIARRVDILQDEDNVAYSAVDCNSLRPADDQYLSDEKIDEMTSRVRVFARAKPADKLEIVKSLQRQGLVCAMTGDGVNDAPALHEARIGVAMGLQGTEVAKGAAEMVLTDDNFTSIVKAVEKGRAIYAGIQKFVAFIMSVHIAEVIQIFFCVVVSMPLMRTPLQILFLILVTDLPPSIALGMEPGERNILEQPPRPKQEPIVLGWMWVSTCLNGLILSAVIIGIYVVALQHYLGVVFLSEILTLKSTGGAGGGASQAELDEIDQNLARARTVAFISLVFCENVRAYICRSFSEPVWVDLFTNPVMQKAVLMAQVAMLCAVLIPFFSTEILGLDGLSIGWWGWLFSLVGPAATLVLCELCKLLTKWQMKRYQRQLKFQSDEGLETEEETESSDSELGRR
ncbi:Calcium-transporting ATPase 1 (BACCA1) [Durusdinium trenchii]|uniref:Calcium-transporting ATPase 1 (BACCA1) n=1 Tax=Durusdinium trenchii TaxID=1381693 RepID=A0ABP0PTI1_9DINO